MGGFGSETLQIQKVPDPASTRWWLNQSRVFWHYVDAGPPVNSKSGEQVEKVEGWKDSVHCAAWSSDGQHLALADMSGVIKVCYNKQCCRMMNQIRPD